MHFAQNDCLHSGVFPFWNGLSRAPFAREYAQDWQWIESWVRCRGQVCRCAAGRTEPNLKPRGLGSGSFSGHFFRRSLATVLTSNKESVKVVQELMRHANSRITMDLYAQGEEKAKRSAQEHVNGLFIVQKKAS
jgi:integrase